MRKCRQEKTRAVAGRVDGGGEDIEEAHSLSKTRAGEFQLTQRAHGLGDWIEALRQSLEQEECTAI